MLYLPQSYSGEVGEGGWQDGRIVSASITDYLLRCHMAFDQAELGLGWHDCVIFLLHLIVL